MSVHPLRYDLIIFDVDGTLRECTIPGQPCPNKPGEWRLLPNVRETLALYDWDTVGFGVVSNQGGVGLGYLSKQDAYDMIVETVHEAAGLDTYLNEMCPHAPNAGCQCRKPRPDMIEMIIQSFWGPCDERTDRVLYVGDMESDRECAEAAGVNFMWATDFFGWEHESSNS